MANKKQIQSYLSAESVAHINALIEQYKNMRVTLTVSEAVNMCVEQAAEQAQEESFQLDNAMQESREGGE